VEAILGALRRTVLARRSGHLNEHRIKIVEGDRVCVELSPYDLSRGIRAPKRLGPVEYPPKETLMRLPATLAIALTVVGCSKEEAKPQTPAASASAVASTSAGASTLDAAPSASATAEAAEPHHDCPGKSSGVGSFAKPCEAKGTERMMTVKWKKTDDKGPSFSIKNIGKATILYGKIAVYFYDKGGKQLDVAADDSGKTKPFHTCSGNFFQGVMKPSESAMLTFSCVPKKVIPEGTAAIEAEMPMVGFADATEKTNDFYWRNADLTPNARPKGGVK
jgi:hypothetical protein